jgi:hypothetical protein
VPEPSVQPSPTSLPPRIVNFEGRRIQVPGDATDEEIQTILSTPSSTPWSEGGQTIAPKTPGGASAQPPRMPIYTIQTPSGRKLTIQAPDEATALRGAREWHEQYMRNGADNRSEVEKLAAIEPQEGFRSRVGWQGTARGIADLAFPLDLINGVINAGVAATSAGSEALGGPEIDYRLLPATDTIASAASKVADYAGFDTVDPEEMSSAEKLVYNANRFGTGAASAGGLISKVPAAFNAAAGPIGRVIAGFAKPYSQKAGGALANDVVGGMGSGAALAGYEHYVPELPDEAEGTWMGTAANVLDPVARVLAMIGGGAGGIAGKSVIEGTGKGLYRSGKKALSLDKETSLPINAKTGEHFNQSEAERAAAMVQHNMASNPAVAAANLRDNVAELQGYSSPSSIPTTGLLSDDVGLIVSENAARRQTPVPFIERDQNVNTAARELLDSMAPSSARGRDFTEEGNYLYGHRVKGAKQNVEDAKLAQAAGAGARSEAAKDLSTFGADTKAARAYDIDDFVFDQTLRPMQEQSSKLFDEAIALGRNEIVDATSLVEQAQAVRQSLGQFNTPSKVIPQGLLHRIEGTVDDAALLAEDAAGLKVAGQPAQVSVADLVQVMPEIASTIGRAQQAGNYALADNLRNLRDSMNGIIERAAAEGSLPAQRAMHAKANYRNTIGETFGQGLGDEATKLRRDFNEDRFKRSTTPPSQTAGRFLQPGQPEKAQSLQRIMQQATGTQADRERAVREYLLSDLAVSGAVDEQARVLRPDVIRKWRDKWGESLNIVPGFGREVDDLIANAQRGDEMAGNLKLDVQAAESKLKSAEVDKGALSLVLGKNPETAVRSIFTSPDPERAMAEIKNLVKNNKKAYRGLKAAVRDYLVEYKTTSAVEKTTTGANPVSFSQLDNLFKQHERVLMNVYSPKEMNNLRAVHKMLATFANRQLGATSGSQTAERVQQDLKQLGLKAWYGILKGGGVFRTVKIALATLPSSKQNVQQIVHQMWFDPELAAHLLTREVDVGTAAWNAKLNRLIAISEGVREKERQSFSSHNSNDGFGLPSR